ncbi:hypothetical protein CAPTEDRAFT_197506 [Capitella teleta]|uniref:Uncharacterized protein n=1 Tax=Capitella teleta TaxID=283909 RepID=R7TSF1_CAPTE|nr:hypothetical protein CAPTEDRAFT_197506 [Capitella teleta]|eukprot:ELT94411.1 hypothetical protein CAPTEDRAFT_197506 [Capitella teleta]
MVTLATLSVSALQTVSCKRWRGQNGLVTFFLHTDRESQNQGFEAKKRVADGVCRAAITSLGTIVLKVPPIGKPSESNRRSKSVQEAAGSSVIPTESPFNSVQIKTPFRCPSLNFEMRVPPPDADDALRSRGGETQNQTACRCDVGSRNCRLHCGVDDLKAIHQRLMLQVAQSPTKPCTPGLYGMAVEKFHRKPENRVANSRVERSNLRAMKKSSESLPNISKMDKPTSRSQSKLSESNAVELNSSCMRLPDINKLKASSNFRQTPTVEEEDDVTVLDDSAYKQAGSTSWRKSDRTRDLKGLTFHHHRKLIQSASALLDKGFKVWSEKIRDFSSGVVDTASYEMFARKPTVKYTIPKVLASMTVTMNKDSRIKMPPEPSSNLKTVQGNAGQEGVKEVAAEPGDCSLHDDT